MGDRKQERDWRPSNQKGREGRPHARREVKTAQPNRWKERRGAEALPPTRPGDGPNNQGRRPPTRERRQRTRRGVDGFPNQQGKRAATKKGRGERLPNQKAQGRPANLQEPCALSPDEQGRGETLNNQEEPQPRGRREQEGRETTNQERVRETLQPQREGERDRKHEGRPPNQKEGINKGK